VIKPSPSAGPADTQDPLLAAAVRLIRRRRRWGWTVAGGFIAFLIAISVYSNQYNDVTNTGPVAVLAVAMAIGALTVAALIMVVVTGVHLRRRSAAQRAQAVSSVERAAARRSRSRWARYDWAVASGVLVLALGVAVLFLPGLVNGASYLAGGNMVRFVPQSHAISCSYHGNGQCQTVTVGTLETGGAGVRSTWPDDVPLDRSFKVREPVWTWGLGAALIDSDGLAVGAALISLLFDGFAVLGVIYFFKVIRDRLGRRRRAVLAARPS
jgi:hypothetical protein